MVPDPDEQRPGAAVRSDGLLQRPEQAFNHVPERWLRTEHLSAAERVDRLAADYDLVTGLAFARFEGPDYDRFATELARYGLAVITGWIRRGLILARCRERGFGGLPEPPAGAFEDPDVVNELANETVGKALHHFRDDVLMTGRWDHRQGASLRTFFIGQCLIRFANIYRQWLKTECRRGYTLTDHAMVEALDRRRTIGPEDRVVDLAETQRALGAIKNPLVRRALVLFAAGVSHQEIGQQLGVTDKAVERMIANERTRMRKRGIA